MGRPREFNVEEALDRALQVFWRRGYEGASLAELTEAMGINPPSLYAAFGSKEGLFRKALDRYVAQRTTFWREALEEPTPRRMVERLLRGTADFLTDACNPRGCLLVRGTVACSDMTQDIHLELVARRRDAEREVCERIQAAKAAGDLPAELNPADLARFVATVLEGMSVHAAGGASREDLHSIVDMALRVWPADAVDGDAARTHATAL